MAILGVDVGGTFTDAVLARRRRPPHAPRCRPQPRQEESVHRRRPRRAGRRRRPELERFAPRDDRRHERASRAEGARTAFVTTDGLRAPPPPAPAEPGAPVPPRRSTIPSPSCRSSAASASRERIGPEGVVDAARSRRRLPDGGRRGHRRVPPVRVPRPVARAGRRRGAAPAPSRRARRRLARGRARVPRVRTRLHDRRRRVPRPRRRAATSGRSRGACRAGAARAARDALLGRRRHDRRGCRAPGR